MSRDSVRFLSQWPQQRREMFQVGGVQRHLQPVADRCDQTIHGFHAMAEMEAQQLPDRPIDIKRGDLDPLEAWQQV